MSRILLIILGLLLLFSLAFGLGFLVGRGTDRAPIIIEKYTNQ